MIAKTMWLAVCCAVAIASSGCSRQQSDWQKTRETNTTDAYEQFLKKYPTGEFTAQAQARVKELYEERDWQKARDADTPEAYQGFLKQYPEGKWTEEARIRVENFTLAQAPSGAAAASPGDSPIGTPPGNTPGEAPDTAPASAATPPAAAPKHPLRAASSSSPPAPAKAPPPATATHSHLAKASTKSQEGPRSFAIQLGAFKTGAGAAHERWALLQKKYPSLLKGLSSKVVPATTASGKLYRLRAVGLSATRARAICRSLKAKSQACVLVPPA